MTAISDAYLAWCKEMGIHHPPALAAAAFESGYNLGLADAYKKVLVWMEGVKMPPTAPTAERQEVTYQDNFSAKEGECQ